MMSEKDEEKRVVLLPPSKELTKESLSAKSGLYGDMVKRGFKTGYVKKAHIGTMLNDAYSAVAEELRKLRAASETDPESLGLAKISAMAKLGATLVLLAREERDQLKDDGIPELSDQELAEQLKANYEEVMRRIGSK